MRKFSLYFSLIVVLFNFSCQKSPFEVDTSNIEVTVDIKRLDVDLFSKNLKLDSVINAYSPFFELYSYQILKLGNPRDSLFPLYLDKFVSDKTMKEVHSECETTFKDLFQLNIELVDAFKHIKYYYPDFSVPKVYTYISGFNQSIVSDSSFIGISLDKYLGADCPFYAYMEIPKYLRTRMDSRRMIRDVVEAYARMDFVKEMEKTDLISAMIYEGKIQYFIKAIIPDYPENQRLNYSKDQLNWLNENEENMWTYLVENKKLFENQAIEIRKFIGEAPFTAAFGNNSSPQAGVFIGQKIVFRYMNENPNVSLNELMNESDAMKILQKSVYNP